MNTFWLLQHKVSKKVRNSCYLQNGIAKAEKKRAAINTSKPAAPKVLTPADGCAIDDAGNLTDAKEIEFFYSPSSKQPLGRPRSESTRLNSSHVLRSRMPSSA